MVVRASISSIDRHKVPPHVVPLVVSLSNHELVLRQAQDERVRATHEALMRKPIVLTLAIVAAVSLQRVSDPQLATRLHAQSSPNTLINPNMFQDLRWRTIGPHRGGRSTAAAGVRTQPNVFYIGTTGGGVFKSDNYGITWTPVTDGQIATGSIDRKSVV